MTVTRLHYFINSVVFNLLHICAYMLGSDDDLLKKEKLRVKIEAELLSAIKKK